MSEARFFSDPENPIGVQAKVPGIALVSRRVTDGGQPISFALRDESGWQLFADDEPPGYSDHAENFSPESLARLIERDEALRDIVAAPEGWMFAARQSRGRRRFCRVHREPPPESLELVTVGWGPFQQSLARALEELSRWSDSFLVISDSETERYVQFHSNDGMFLSAESVGDEYLEEPHKLGAAVTTSLIQAGWLPPTDPRSADSGNFFRDWYNPAPYARIAELAVYTLRDLHQAQVTRLELRWDL